MYREAVAGSVVAVSKGVVALGEQARRLLQDLLTMIFGRRLGAHATAQAVQLSVRRHTRIHDFI